MRKMMDRALNTDLLLTYGVDAWKLRGIHLEEELTSLQKQIAEIKSRTTYLNRERKREHVSAKKQLDALEEEWITLINTTLQTKIASQQLKERVA